jgi:nickel-dependent lactate racemase
MGCHGAHNRLDFEKKLGKEVLARYPVYNHNPFACCTYVGKTKTYGTEVHINEEVMKCDFKIAVGLAAPHPASGFGGGGKIIMPGVASFKSIEHNHRSAFEDAIKNQGNPVIGMGLFENNPMRFDIEEAATMAGLDVLINCIVNMWGETVSIFAGALEPAYTAAVNEAKSHYKTPKTNGEHIIIANTFTKANEAIAVGLGTAFSATSPEGGDVVLIANAPDGQVTHYLLGTFGRVTPAPLGFRLNVPQHVNRVFIFSEYSDVAGRDYIENSEKVLFKRTWEDVLAALMDSYGSDVKIAVFPSADIQYSS